MVQSKRGATMHRWLAGGAPTKLDRNVSHIAENSTTRDNLSLEFQL